MMESKNPELDAESKARRQARMAILAQADSDELQRLWRTLDLDPECTVLRGPEAGLVALRGRIGGGGAPFNFGEATITRTTIRLGNGAVGHAVMLGRDETKVKLAAVIDALAIDDAYAEKIEATIIQPLRQMLAAADEKRRAETAATKVDFFTMVRGED